MDVGRKLWRCVRPIVVLSAAFFLATVSPAPSQPPDLKTRITDLYAALPVGANDTAAEAWRADAENLRIRLSTLLQNVDQVAAATKRAGELEVLLGKVEVSNSTTLRDAVGKLADQIGKIEDNDPGVAFKNLTTRVVTLTNSVSYSQAGGQFGTLLDALIKLQDTNPQEAVTRRTNDLISAIDKHLSDNAALYSVETVRTQIGALRAKLDNLAPLQARIHILGAEYGDLRRNASASRRCNATAGMIKLCERFRKCEPGENDIAGLCGGYDPAMLADPEIKGVRIYYQCIATSDTGWAQLQNSGNRPNTSTGIEAPITRPNGPYQEVVLRKGTQSFVCSPELRN